MQRHVSRGEGVNYGMSMYCIGGGEGLRRGRAGDSALSAPSGAPVLPGMRIQVQYTSRGVVTKSYRCTLQVALLLECYVARDVTPRRLVSRGSTRVVAATTDICDIRVVSPIRPAPRRPAKNR